MINAIKKNNARERRIKRSEMLIGWSRNASLRSRCLSRDLEDVLEKVRLLFGKICKKENSRGPVSKSMSEG